MIYKPKGARTATRHRRWQRKEKTLVSGAEWDVGHAPVEILNKSLHKKIISTSKLNILYSRK